MKNLPASAAAEFAVRGAECLAAGVDDCESRIELAEWLSAHLADAEKLREAKLWARNEGPDALAYFQRAVRLIGGTIEVETNGTKEYVVLIGMPLFITGGVLPNRDRTTDWGCRQLMERYLESALGLSMLSVRFAAFPVESVPLSQLGPVEHQRLLTDLLRYGDSRVVQQAPLVFDGEERGLVWPALIRFPAESYPEKFARYREALKLPKIQRFRSFAARELIRTLRPLAADPVVEVYPPVQMADCVPAYRLLKLSRAARHIMLTKPDVASIIYRFSSGRLTVWFLGENSCLSDVADFDFAEDRPQEVYAALDYVGRTTGLQVEQVHELPVLPGQATNLSN